MSSIDEQQKFFLKGVVPSMRAKLITDFVLVALIPMVILAFLNGRNAQNALIEEICLYNSGVAAALGRHAGDFKYNKINEAIQTSGVAQ